MTRTLVLVDHPVGKRDDRASRMLAARGYRIEWCCPGKGDALPAPGPEHAGAVVYGGAESVYEAEAKPYIRREIDWIGGWLAADKPFLGFCLGAQLLARGLGAEVARHPEGLHEIGYVPVHPTAAADGFLDAPLHVYHWHKDGFELPDGAELLATGEVFPNQAFRYGSKTYGLQFHPEIPPPVFDRWIREAGHMLAEPGAHAAERQRRDAERFDAPLAAWLERFFDLWLGNGHRQT